MGPVERFVAASLRQRPFVLLCLAAFVVTGVVAWREVPVEAFPDLTNNQVVVVTEAPGLAAVEVEQRVTYPIETALMGAPGASEVRSLSKFGLSMITVVFEDRVPVYFARQLVTERLADARSRIPAGLEPTLGPVATAFGEIYQYLVEGDADPMEKKTLHDWDVRARLRSVKGVSEVNSWGGLTKQYHVIVYPRRLDRYSLSLHQVVQSVTDNNASFSGGFVEHRSERFTVRGSGLATGVEDLRRIVLASVEGVPILVGDVADVGVGPLPRSGAVTRDGTGETVAGMVIMLQGENGKDVATRVKARIAEVQKTLPAGMRLAPFYDQSEVIDRTSHTVTKNLLEGSLLVVAVLFFFLRDVRASLVVASVIPLAMLAGFLGMRLFGVSANLMSLGAIDFGLIVDGAVVMMENFIRRRAEHDPTGEPDFVADPASHRRRFFTSAATEVARPVLFGVLIIVAVYVPVFTLEGLEGKMFRPMAITVCAAILGALLLALTVVPVASSYLLKLAGTEHEEAWFLRLRRYYVAHLEDAMNHPRRTLSVALAVVTVAMASLAFIGTEFMPRLDEGAILVETRKLPSISLEESAAISTRVEQIIRRFPEVKQVVTKIGRPDVATEAMGIYQGDVYVNLHPMDEWKSGWSKEQLIERMATALAEMPGVACNFTQPMAMRLDEVVSGVKADVAVKVFGPDPATLERVGEEIRAVLDKVRGAADLQVEVLSGAAQVQIDIDRARIARYGLNVSDVRELVETAIGGATATEILDGPRRFDVVVRFPDEVRGDPERLGQLLLTAPGRREGAARERRRHPHDPGPGGREPRERPASARRADERPRPRRRQLRGRGAAADGLRREAARRLFRRVGRAVREPAAGHASAHGRDPGVARDHLPAALPDLRSRSPGGPRHPERAVRSRRRRRGPLDPRPQPEPLRLGRLHRPLRRGGPQRHRDDRGHQPASRGRPPRAAAVDPPGRRHPAQAGPDDGPRGRPGLRSHGALARGRGRGPAAARQRRHRRHHHLDAADADRAPDPLRAHRGLGAAAPGRGLTRTPETAAPRHPSLRASMEG